MRKLTPKIQNTISHEYKHVSTIREELKRAGLWARRLSVTPDATLTSTTLTVFTTVVPSFTPHHIPGALPLLQLSPKALL